jgi:hypothetical protein
MYRSRLFGIRGGFRAADLMTRMRLPKAGAS